MKSEINSKINSKIDKNKHISLLSERRFLKRNNENINNNINKSIDIKLTNNRINIFNIYFIIILYIYIITLIK